MFGLSRIAVMGVTGLLVVAGGTASAAPPPSSGYRLEIHECWIGGVHYGSRTTEKYQAHVYTVTQQVYLTSPGVKAHRAEWKLSSDGVVQYSLGGSKKTKNDVPKEKTFYPAARFEEQPLVFTVWDYKKGYFCRDSHPTVIDPLP